MEPATPTDDDDDEEEDGPPVPQATAPRTAGLEPNGTLTLHEGPMRLLAPGKVVEGMGSLALALAPSPDVTFGFEAPSRHDPHDFVATDAQLEACDLGLSTRAHVLQQDSVLDNSRKLVADGLLTDGTFGDSTQLHSIKFDLLNFHEYAGEAIADSKGSWAGRAVLQDESWVLHLHDPQSSEQREGWSWPATGASAPPVRTKRPRSCISGVFSLVQRCWRSSTRATNSGNVIGVAASLSISTEDHCGRAAVARVRRWRRGTGRCGRGSSAAQGLVVSRRRGGGAAASFPATASASSPPLPGHRRSGAADAGDEGRGDHPETETEVCVADQPPA